MTNALVRRVAAVMAATSSEALPISCLGTDNNVTGHPLAKMIQILGQKAVCDLGFRQQGIREEDVGSHWLWARVAMSMNLNGCNMVQIMKAGQWTSLTFLIYIRNQIAHLGTDISQRITAHVPLFSFGGVQ